eukprot:3177102-Rhodomonas_salina.1
MKDGTNGLVRSKFVPRRKNKFVKGKNNGSETTGKKKSCSITCNGTRVPGTRCYRHTGYPGTRVPVYPVHVYPVP